MPDGIAESTTLSNRSTVSLDVEGTAVGTPNALPQSDVATARMSETSATPLASDQTADPLADPNDEQSGESPISAYAEVASKPPEMPRPEALVISERERDLLGGVGPMIPTPRAAKRLVNIYRMLRVSVPEDELEAFQPQGGKEHEAVTVLLAILVGRPALAPVIFGAVMSAPDEGDVREILIQFPEVSRPLADVFEDITITLTGVYRRWAPRVARFSFHLGERLSEAGTATAEKATGEEGSKGDGWVDGDQPPLGETSSRE
jgi:hypothetical protein